jgi:hypothetical protein
MTRIGPSKSWKIRPRKDEEQWDGWVYPTIPKPMGGNQVRLNRYDRDYAALLATENRFDPGDAASWAALHAKLAKVTEAKLTPILFIPPTLVAKRYYPSQLAGLPVAVLDFSDPRKYPDLFKGDNHLDGLHLNASGAKLFTEAMAWQFVEWMKKSGHAP